MPTFENGWICRECWSANREFDSRCYRCHADRPETLGEPVQLAGQQATARSAPIVVATTVQAGADDEVEMAAAAPPTAARAGVRYCLRCGHQLLVGASFCTRCGTAASEEAAASDPVTHTLVPTPGKARTPAGRSLPAFRLPDLPRLPDRELVARVPTLYHNFVARHAMAWEVVMSSLAAAFVFMQLLPRWIPAAGGWAGALSAAITGVFLVEYATRLGAAPDPRSFLRSHPIELAAVLPPLRALRILRLTWMKWLEPGWRSVASRFAMPSLPEVRAARGGTSLLVAWSLLLVVTAALVWSVGSGGGIGDRGPLSAVAVVCLATFGGLTGSMLTLFAVRHDARSGEASEGLAVLARMREAGRLDATEYGALRKVLLPRESAAAAPPSAGSAPPVEGAPSPAVESARLAPSGATARV